MSSIIAASALTFIAGCAFFESDSTRATLINHAGKARLKAVLRLAAYGLLIAAMALCIQVSGLARGIPTWIGMLMVFGLGSVLMANWQQRFHKAGGIVATVIALAALLAVGMGAD